MDNIIEIKLKEKPEKDYNIFFESPPTSSELVASIIILQEVLEHNFDRQEILTKFCTLYGRIRDIEEVPVVEAIDQNGKKVRVMTER